LQTFAARLDEIGKRVMDSRGEDDERDIRTVIAAQRVLAIFARLTIYLGILYAPLFVLGAILLGIAKIIENMEIGHNVLHGQWAWLRDKKIHSSTWEWDGVCPSRQWQRSHNFIHHKWTN